MVAKTMKTDTTGIQEQDLQDENSPLNVNTYNIKLVTRFYIITPSEFLNSCN